MKRDPDPGLATLEKLLSRELTKLAREDERRAHLHLVSEKGGIPPGAGWAEMRHQAFNVRITSMKTQRYREELRAVLRKNELRINSRHSDFWIRYRPHKRVDGKLISYVVLLVAGHYIASSEPDQEPTEMIKRVTQVACTLENTLRLRFSMCAE